MSDGSPRVSVVIPSWNGRGQLAEVLGSLARQTDGEFETVVVDNGSTDGSLEYLAAAWPGVRILALDRNEGFAAAVNRGISATSAPYVALVNNDVELEPHWIETVVRVLEHEPRAGSVASKLLDWSRRNVLDGAGDLVGWDGYCVRRGKGERDRGQYDGSRDVISACAAAALYRREALDDVGEFDERFFAYIEDVDWGMRAQLAGWDCIYEPTAVAYHVGGASSSRIDGFELFQCHRNIVAMMVKNFPVSMLLAFAPWLVARRVGSLAKAAGRGEAGVLLGAWGAGLGELPASLRSRRRVQRRRRRGVGDLLRRMRPAYFGAGWRGRPADRTLAAPPARRSDLPAGG